MALCAGLAGAAFAADDGRPVQVIGDKIQEVQALIRQHGDEYRLDHSKFRQVVDEVVAPAFDLAYISQLVLGRQWGSATTEQRTRFQAAFKSTLIDFYSGTLLQSADTGSAKWLLSEIDVVERTAAVRAQRPQKSGPPTSIRFDMRLDDENRWRVYDVTIAGLSLTANFRSQFGAELKRNGLDALIARLESGIGSTLPIDAAGTQRSH